LLTKVCETFQTTNGALYLSSIVARIHPSWGFCCLSVLFTIVATFPGMHPYFKVGMQAHFSSTNCCSAVASAYIG